MKYFISFSKMDADFAKRAAIDRPETVAEMEDRRSMLFENSAFFHRVVGLWPKEDQLFGNFRAWKCRAGIFSTIAIALMQYCVLAVNEDKSRRAEDCIEAAMATSVFVKILPCVLNRKKLIELYHKTLEMTSHLKESSAEKKIVYKWLSLQKKLSSYICITYSALIFSYFVYPVIQGDLFPLTPALVPKALHKFPWNALVYVYDIIVVSGRIISMVSCDVYLVILMCQLCCELQIVGNAMLTIDGHDKKTVYRAILKHRRALEYGQLIIDKFSSPLVAQHCSMSIGMCFAALGVLFMTDEALIFKFMLIGSIVMLEILLLNFVGEKIAGECLKIAGYVEDKFDGFIDDPATLKVISFMLLRAQKPLKLRVGTSTIINLDLFRVTMSKIFSCFVILKRAMAAQVAE